MRPELRPCKFGQVRAGHARGVLVLTEEGVEQGVRDQLHDPVVLAPNEGADLVNGLIGAANAELPAFADELDHLLHLRHLALSHGTHCRWQTTLEL